MISFRIGFGFDVHRLEKDYPLWLGGIRLEHTKGAVGHSDADVLIHAICDALLGAANLRDIGFHFPPDNLKYKGIDSKILLGEVIQLLNEHNYLVVNIDATVCAERPKINPFIPQMQQILSEVIGINASEISIKATTNEKLGFIGQEEGITAYAVVLINKN
ncbi:2-C-methyl-D-erythritol 2,4-cyclodiphosphate synthase [Flavobacteriales bacterium]|nr:MAG: 2-C-methyl-D-erythritol 2,4-cyclodiphosphate synthase [Bacteroidota bacterium]CAG0971048.1 2-C-methyl-D-erythritol 2,4-cyclodiphosphate synthase [Flavobacteriales bacterium]